MADFHPVWALAFVTIAAALWFGIWQISRVNARRRKDDALPRSAREQTETAATRPHSRKGF